MERNGRSLPPHTGATDLQPPPGPVGVVLVHSPQATGPERLQTAGQNKRPTKAEAHTMAEATCSAKCSEEGADTLSRLNGIFDAFWAKMESRERQAEMEAYSHTGTTAQPTYSRAAIPSKGARRWRHRRRPFPPKRKSRRLHRTSRQNPLKLNTSPTATMKPRRDSHSSLHQIRTPLKRS
ncbi:Hypothetical predicted protein [Pelobates cultripes]|uniref:Uncharacterized protein n=1 Tax=Pelobates cultripes TaxID=61616 RepID=A0AAD1SNA7_PELCU|nr:Hypothetical predicted protein [Pelobates cultripes]